MPGMQILVILCGSQTFFLPSEASASRLKKLVIYWILCLFLPLQARRVSSWISADWSLRYKAKFLEMPEMIILWVQAAGCELEWYC